MTGEREEKYLVFSLGGQDFAADITVIKEIRAGDRVAAIPESPDYLLGLMDLRGKVIPLVDLRRRLRVTPTQDGGVVIVVELPGQLVGLVVDRVVEVLSLPPAAWEAAPALISGPARRFVAGVADLQGRLIVLLDLARVLTGEEVAALEDLAEAFAS